MKRGKIFTIVALVLSIIIIGYHLFLQLNPKNSSEELQTDSHTAGISNTENTEDESAASVQASIEAEEASKAEEASRQAEEEKNRREKMIAENTIYVSSGTALYESSSADSEIIKNFERRVSLYVERSINDEDGKLQYYEVKENYDNTEKLGFILAKDAKKSLSDFIYAPQADSDYSPYSKSPEYPDNKRIDVKAVYLTLNSATNQKFDQIIDLVDKTDLNAMVIDVKDDNGYLLFKSETAAKHNPSKDVWYATENAEELIKKAKDKGIYLIARIVTFKSPIYAREHLDKAITYAGTNTPYVEGGSLYWTSPYDKNLWDYNIGISIEAAKLGFDEIQFDYVRFPTVPQGVNVDYKNDMGIGKTAVIQEFLKYSNEKLRPHNVYISADVFGWAGTAVDDVGIGQHWEAISNVCDYICPMVYPSHYGRGNFGLQNPDTAPYHTVSGSIKDCIARNKNIETPAIIRPWIQYFTASYLANQGLLYIPYGPKEVQDQIRALSDNGINEYLLWNPSNIYEFEAFNPAE